MSVGDSVAVCRGDALDTREIRIGLLGCGNVGQAVVRSVAASVSGLATAGIRAVCTMALVRDADRPRVNCTVPVTMDVANWRQHAFDVVVEVLGGVEPARTLVADVLRSGTPVVTANKSLVATHGLELTELAATHHAGFYYEAAVLAGVPCVNTLARRPLASAAGRWAGIINGTSNFILTEMDRGRSLDAALVAAVAKGYAEPSAASGEDADLSGRDAAEKLTILLRLAGLRGATPASFPRQTIADVAPWHISLAHRLGGVIKPVALADTALDGGAWIGPAFVPSSHPFASVHGVTNVLAIGRDDNTVWFSGPGAGPDVTAATVVDDVLEAVSDVATGGRRTIPTLGSPDQITHATRLTQPGVGKWFLLLDGLNGTDGVTVTDSSIAEFLAAHHLPAVAIVRDGRRVAVVTVAAPFSVVRAVVTSLQAGGGTAMAWPVLETLSASDSGEGHPRV